MEKNDKVQIVLSSLQERYNASHKIRERSVQFVLWLSGLAVGLGWILISEQIFTFYQKIALTLLITALFVGALCFLWGLMKGANNNRNTLIRHEEALKMYESGVYLPDKSLLPEAYCKINLRWTDHFCTLFIWLIVMAMSLIILTWTCPNQDGCKPCKSSIEQNVKEHKTNG